MSRFKVGDLVMIGPDIFNTTRDSYYHKLYGKVFTITSADAVGYRLDINGNNHFIFEDKELLPVTRAYFHKLGQFYA